jgi:putative transposase
VPRFGGMRPAYPSDLSDAEFAVLAPALPPPCARGRPWKHPLRAVLDGVFYVVRTGCQWRCLPREYPPWPTVYWWFTRWRRDGTWERLNAALRERVRRALGRDPQPSAGIVDSQSVKTSGVGGVRGFDGAKRVNGRKRHLLVDTLGLVLKAVVHPADVQDRAGVPLLLDGIARAFPRLEHVWLDQGYTGSGQAWIAEHLGWSTEVVQHPRTWGRGVRGVADPTQPYGVRIEAVAERGPRGFRGPLPRRWTVERTFAWLLHSRRLARDDERLTSTDEALVYAAMTRLMARRLARQRRRR